MNRRLFQPDGLERLLQPENELEAALLAAPALRKGLLWGEPRFGHPEGTVAVHVREVLDNINQIPALSTTERNQLRLVALVHDGFKYAEDRSRPRDWSKHHGVLARQFLEVYTSEPTVLDVVEAHDDAYYAWLHQNREKAPRTLSGLLQRMDYCLQFYYLFFKCDTQTGDKTQAPLRWFERTVKGLQVVKFKPYWPWEKD